MPFPDHSAHNTSATDCSVYLWWKAYFSLRQRLLLSGPAGKHLLPAYILPRSYKMPPGSSRPYACWHTVPLYLYISGKAVYTVPDTADTHSDHCCDPTFPLTQCIRFSAQRSAAVPDSPDLQSLPILSCLQNAVNPLFLRVRLCKKIRR